MESRTRKFPCDVRSPLISHFLHLFGNIDLQIQLSHVLFSPIQFQLLEEEHGDGL